MTAEICFSKNSIELLNLPGAAAQTLAEMALPMQDGSTYVLGSQKEKVMRHLSVFDMIHIYDNFIWYISTLIPHCMKTQSRDEATSQMLL